MNEPRVVWGDDGFASSDGWAFIHSVDPVTSEYQSSFDVWVSVGTGLPAGAFLQEPPAKQDGKAIVMVDGAWCLVDDYRGLVAYNKQNRQAVIVQLLGPLSDNLTFLAPESQFDVWSEESQCWIKDAQAEHEWLTIQATQHRSLLLGEASNEIAALLDALDPDVISNPDDAVQVKLLEWKQYRAALAVIDCSVHPVQWPVKPV